MKRIDKIFICFCLLGAIGLSACSDDKIADFATFEPAEGLVTYIPDLSPKSLLVIPDTNVVIGIDGLKVQDVLQLRSKETGKYMTLTWGMYCSEDNVDESGNYIFATDRIIAALKEHKDWNVGKWDLILHRNLQEQVIASYDVNALTLDDSKISTELAFNGIIDGIYAKGWQSSEVDSMLIVNKKTGKQYVLGTPGNPELGIKDKVMFSFQRIKGNMESGDYTLYLRRWKYDFKQKICDFNYFLFTIVNKTPIVADKDGKFRIMVTMDKIKEGDYLKVIYGTGKNSFFTHELTENNYGAQKMIYTVEIPSDKVRDYNYNIHFYRNNVDVNIGSIKVNPEE